MPLHQLQDDLAQMTARPQTHRSRVEVIAEQT